MKKIYTSPLVKVVNINAEQIICGSDTVTLSATKYNGSATIESKDDEDFIDELW